MINSKTKARAHFGSAVSRCLAIPASRALPLDASDLSVIPYANTTIYSAAVAHAWRYASVLTAITRELADTKTPPETLDLPSFDALAQLVDISPYWCLAARDLAEAESSRRFLLEEIPFASKQTHYRPSHRTTAPRLVVVVAAAATHLAKLARSNSDPLRNNPWIGMMAETPNTLDWAQSGDKTRPDLLVRVDGGESVVIIDLKCTGNITDSWLKKKHADVADTYEPFWTGQRMGVSTMILAADYTGHTAVHDPTAELWGRSPRP